jgi:hypothetical protein
MRNYLLLISLFIIQIVVPAQEHPLLDELRSENKYRRESALVEICHQKLSYLAGDVVTILSEEREGIVLIKYLETLKCLEFDGLYEITQQLLSEVESFDISPTQKRILKGVAYYILLNFGDTAGTDFILSDINPQHILVIYLESLMLIHDLVPEKREEVVNFLKQVVENTFLSGYRNVALNWFYEVYGSDTKEYIIYVFKNNSAFSIRMEAAELLVEMDYENSNSLLKDRLSVDPASQVRLHITSLLASKYGRPSDIKYILDHIIVEPDPETAKLMNYFDVEEFIPPHPDYQSTTEKIETLNLYIEELYQYEWITDHEIYTALSGDAVMISELYNQQDIMELCTVLNKFLSDVKDSYREYITKEGYKYLHYYAVYIKHAVEEEFNTCPE